jgi:hypothetical protein
MTDENLVLWNSVEKTDPKQVKKITGKPYQGSSPKPFHLVHKATEIFGPCGIGWGLEIVHERVEDGAEGDKVHIAHVRIWYLWQGKRGQVEHVGQTMFSGRRNDGKLYTDEDAPKKSVTDAMVKALSMIGFAGDIFMGRYDDSKYVSELVEEFRGAPPTEAARPAPKRRPTPIASDDEPTLTERAMQAESLLRKAATQGSENLRMEWSRVSPDLKPILKGLLDNTLKGTARKFDGGAVA